MSHQNRKSFLYWLWQNHLKISSNGTEAGNTLIIALSLGVLMIGATTTMLFTSNKSKTNTTSDEMSVRAQEVAELGITRAIDFFARNPQFAMDNKPENATKWDSSNSPVEISSIPEGSYSNDSSSNNTCSTVLSQTQNASIIAQASNEFVFEQLVNSNNSNQGKFVLQDYQIKQTDGNTPANFEYIESNNNNNSVSPGTTIGFGELDLESSLTNSSQARIKATFPIVKKSPMDIPFPGVWLADQSGTSRENPVDADVMISAEDCNNLQLKVEEGRKFIISSATFPNMPVFPVESNPGVYNLGDLIGADMNITLPRSGDQYDNDVNKVYHYIVNKISGSGSRTLTITPGKKVYIYLKGDMEVKGSAEISHLCGSVSDCHPDNFRIYGYGYNQADMDKTPSEPKALNGQTNGNSYASDPLLCLRGSGASQGFIFAPGYQAMVSGSGSNDAFYGTVWIKRWAGSDVNCGSSTSNTVITQDTTDWNTLGLFPQGLAPRIGTISSWQREQVN